MQDMLEWELSVFKEQRVKMQIVFCDTEEALCGHKLLLENQAVWSVKGVTAYQEALPRVLQGQRLVIKQLRDQDAVEVQNMLLYYANCV